MSAIEVNELSKTFRVFSRREGVMGSVKDLFHREYSDLNAVDKISFSIEQGEIVGYIGPNGAGKSTSIKMLTGILKPTSGEMNVLGFHPFKDRKAYTKHIGVVFGQRTQLWWDIAVIESFKLLGKIYEVPKADFDQRLEMLTDILGMKEFLHTPVRKLSLGQRLRSDLAASLLHGPKILFLDEPTIGLDAVAKDSIRTFLRKINQEMKTTVLLTTHDLKEIEELCERIVVVDHGKIIYDGDLKKIRTLPGLGKNIVIDFAGPAPVDALCEKFSGKAEFEKLSERRVEVQYDPQSLPTVSLVQDIVGSFEIADFNISEPDIEEVIMKIYRDGV